MRAAALCLLSMLAAGAFAADASNSKFHVSGQQIEGCECSAPCPCIFSKDATMDECRAMLGFRVDEGNYGSTDLRGIDMVAVMTKSGKNVDKAIGHLQGILYISDKATEQQKAAAAAVMQETFAGVFEKMDIKSAPIAISGADGKYQVKLGAIGNLQTEPLKGAGGEVPVIENAPSPLALPKTYCAKATVNTYDDGSSKWDFAGRNSFYGPFVFASKETN